MITLNAKSGGEMLAEAGTRAELLKADIDEKAGGRARQEEERMRTSASIDAKKRVLAEKQKAISAVFSAVLEEIKNMDKAGYQAIVGKMFSSADGDEEVIIPSSEKRIDAAFIQKVNKAYFKKKAGLRLSAEKREMPGGGFILKKERVEKNSSFAVILNSLRPVIERQLADMLFK
jgi:vacuolar-type H+-ATPase subunit E/Vma4